MSRYLLPLLLAMGYTHAQSSSQPAFDAPQPTTPIDVSEIRAADEAENQARQQNQGTPDKAVDLLTPLEIQRLRDSVDAQEEVLRRQEAPDSTRGVTSRISLAAGSIGIRIPIAHGFATSLEFVDSAGNPFPIKSTELGQEGAFKITQPNRIAKDATEYPPGSNVLIVSSDPAHRFAATNIVVLLAGETRTLSIILTATDVPKSLSDRFTLVVDAFSPLTPEAIVKTTAPLEQTLDMYAVIDGQSPSGSAVELFPHASETDTTRYDGKTRYWRDGKTLWMRTDATLLVPAPIKEVRRGDLRAYQLSYVPTVMLSIRGKPTQVNLGATR